jgi:multiple sugar transport system ATP-binding protein
MASVTLRHLTKKFDAAEHAAPDALSLDIPDGELLVLLGPSGCGKTTALRCIAGLEEPTAGEILIDERDVTSLPPAARDVAMVFQNYALFPHLSVRENLAFPLELRRLPKVEVTRRVRDAAERLGLGDLLERRPGQLSGGQRQRVALGRAIVREPRVFLFDEPLSNLDARLRAEMRREILDLHKSLRATMIYVTHDQVEAMTMGQRIALLHEGRLRQVGTPVELYGHPCDEFVARFFGSPGMNVLPARPVRKGRRDVACGSLRLRLRAVAKDDLQLGVRPEHVELCRAGQGNGDARVRLLEPLGSDTLVHLVAGEVTLVAKVPGIPAIADGDLVGVRVETSHLHRFDTTGVRVE